MHLSKFFWGLRALAYKIKFRSFGNFSYIGKPIYLSGTKKVTIANKVRIFPGLRMEVYGKNGKITIEENVSIGQNLHITSSDDELIIGKNTTILGNVYITNIDHEYRIIGKHIMDQDYIIKKTIIGENCFIGFGVGIQAGTILGKQCIIGSNSIVRGTFPDYCVIAGAPAKVVKKYNHNNGIWENEIH
ncbi:MAG: dapH 1 [Clostridiales bacterium]|jgi:acetyltransferase-like isoleucine patch superfamily enzyme|nr:dapH 1 [Clostridiales bacterium]